VQTGHKRETLQGNKGLSRKKLKVLKAGVLNAMVDKLAKKVENGIGEFEKKKQMGKSACALYCRENASRKGGADLKKTQEGVGVLVI